MHTGMLWFDNSQKPLEEKIKSAITYYQKKYGRVPDLVFVHPSMLDKNTKRELSWIEQPDLDLRKPPETPSAVLIIEHKLTVRPYRPVLPGHIWVGIEDKN